MCAACVPRACRPQNSSDSDTDSDSTPDGYGSRAHSASAIRGGGGRGRGSIQQNKRGWQLESMLREDDHAMGSLSANLEKLRREQPPPNQPPALLGAKAFFLDRRLIMHVARGGGTGVVLPRSQAAAARRY